MKGKKYSTEDNIRILRQAADGGRSILEVCREANISEVTFHRWKTSAHSAARPLCSMWISSSRELRLGYIG